jgi:lysophospholipid acyltransferase (LPLAT)-like uncharacterized protein
MASQLLSRFITTRTAATAAYWFIRLHSWTYRLQVDGERHWMRHLEQGGRVVLAVFHGSFLPAICHFRGYAELSPCLMISRSADGELIAGVAERVGWRAVRGSSSAGGPEALGEIIDHLRRFDLAAHIVDGPKGPAGRVKPGLIRLARESEAAIVPFYVTADRAWHMNSWDRFMVPKPGAGVRLRFAEAILLDGPNDEPTRERQRHEVEAIMRRDGWDEPAP